MCGRFTLTDPDPRRLRLRFDLDEAVEIDEKPRFNIAPTDPVLAVRGLREGRRELGRLRWGLVPEKADPGRFGGLLINARAETVDQIPAFRDAFRLRRCLVLADGFYEWRQTETGKQPVWITLPDRGLFALAGLWSTSRSGNDGQLHSCAIVTCDASDQVRPIHDRMPVILEPEEELAWLNPDAKPGELLSVLGPTEELQVTQVCDAVNDVREDGPHLLAPPLRLF